MCFVFINMCIIFCNQFYSNLYVDQNVEIKTIIITSIIVWNQYKYSQGKINVQITK